MIDKKVLDNFEAMFEAIYEDIDVEEEYDDEGFIWVHMISSYEAEEPTRVGVDYLIPQAYTFINLDGWINVVLQEGENVARPNAPGRCVEY